MQQFSIVQLLTLWFAVLVFLQTGSGGSGGFETAAASLALVLLYAVPAVIAVVLYERFTEDGGADDVTPTSGE